MLSNYFRISFRHLWKNKTSTAINVLGLTVGLSSGILIFLLVSYLFSFDRYRATALSSPNTVVLSERYAQKYFGSTDIIGRVLRFDNQQDLAVTGVIGNPLYCSLRQPGTKKLAYAKCSALPYQV